jgi:L-ascorbate metabolism protein UlaG (beta-lactamase superfamily)
MGSGSFPVTSMRRIVLIPLGLASGLVAVGAGLHSRWSTPRWDGSSSHFDGERFQNVPSVEHGGLGAIVRWMLNREKGPWREWTDAPPGPPPPRRVGAGELRVTFVNHATTLVQVDGLNILTDPIWSERASPVSWAGPRRHRPPGLRFEDLPPIDAVLVSHNHYDHLDLPTLRRLAQTHRPRIFAGLGNGAILERAGVPAGQELEWWQSAVLPGGVQVVAVPAQHFSGRSLTDRDRALWAGWVVQGRAGAVYFAGDTGYGPHFAAIRQRLGPIRLALLPIGAFRPRWFMQRVHLAPEEAVRAAGDLGAGTAVAIHFGTFHLGDDGEEEAPALLAEAVAAHEPRPRFWVLGFGEGRDVPPLPAPCGEDSCARGGASNTGRTAGERTQR